MDFFYTTIFGRCLLKVLLHTNILKIAEKYMKSGKSQWLIDRYIRKYNIDMSEFRDKEYKCFADFFARTKNTKVSVADNNELISPCDGLLSSFNIDNDSSFLIKGLWFSINDLVPEKEYAKLFDNGLCLVFRLQASDYHHFCYIDECFETGAKLIPGMLHSVQPIALEKEPVFRLNKRYYHLLQTENFGPVLQIEVGAVLVGGVYHEKEDGKARKGEEMGHFELCGSTIILLFTEEIKKKFSLLSEIEKSVDGMVEYPVKMGMKIGSVLNNY